MLATQSLNVVAHTSRPLSVKDVDVCAGVWQLSR